MREIDRLKDFLEKYEYHPDYVEKMETYKHIWYRSKISGNWKRETKSKYHLEKLANLFSLIGFKKLSFLGKKPTFDKFYEYYVDVIKKYVSKKEYGKGFGEFETVRYRLLINGVDIKNKRILDISGEPGFFAKDLISNGAKEVYVTAYSKKVAETISNLLNVNSFAYDFNKDKLSELIGGKFDIIFLRWCVGFVENMFHLLEEMKKLINDNGVVYISYSPPSNAIMTRWMFDDYTYLRLYDKSFLKSIFRLYGFSLIEEFNEGSYKWYKNLKFPIRILSYIYGGLKYLKDIPENEKEQHNITFIFQYSGS